MIPFLSEHFLSNNKKFHIYDYDFNVGVIGFFNEELKNLYIQNYQNLALSLSKYKYLHLIDSNKHEFNVPDWVLEQQLICNLTEDNSIRFVLPVDSLDFIKDRDLIAKEIGYTHLLGSSKYRNDIVEKIKNKLKEMDYDCFNKISENIKQICKN